MNAPLEDQKRHFLEMVEKMPAFPHSVNRLMEMSSSVNCAPKDLVKVIEHDPVLTMKILKLVNSAYFGLSRTINSINHGVVFVGINAIKNLALSIAAIGMIPRQNDAGLDMDEFLVHSLGVATLSKSLARRIGIRDQASTDYFIAGLLHDFGKVVFAQFMPKGYRTVLARAREEQRPLHQVEQELIGADHAEIGAMLAENWELPGTLVEAIARHHHVADQPLDSPLLDCLFAANQIMHASEYGDSGNPVGEDLPPHVRERLGASLAELAEACGDLSELMSQVRAFIHA